MTTERSSAVVAKDVSKVFFAGADPVWALEDFSLTLEEGSFTCIVGPSGCGKSTFLRILGGLEERTIGELERSEEHTSERQSRGHLVCRLLLEKKNTATLQSHFVIVW